MEIKRVKDLKILNDKLTHFPAVAILGPRQCGKTTLARQFLKERGSPNVHYFDLENPSDLAKLDEPMSTLENLSGLVVIDEIQRRPELFPLLRVLIDRVLIEKKLEMKFLILGSASRDLIHQSSETLAGRISYMEICGFSQDVLPKENLQKLWTRGGFPPSYLEKDDESSFKWRREFIATFLERDIPNLGIGVPAQALRRFWTMLSHYHGQIFNASEIARSLGVSDHTARNYLDILSGTFMIRQILPWFYNTRKRLVKRPKIYLRDSGIFHTLISAITTEDVLFHPRLGASWEGFALEQTIQHLNLRQEEVFFWGLHTGGELDLIFQAHGKLWGIEAKYTDAPRMTPSIKSAFSELSLAHVWVIYPGKENYPIDRQVTAVSLQNLESIRI